MTYMKLNEYLKCEEDCNKALNCDPTHVKSLNRRGKARKRLNKYKEALADFYAADRIETNNSEILAEIRVIKSKINTITDEQKKKMVIN